MSKDTSEQDSLKNFQINTVQYSTIEDSANNYDKTTISKENSFIHINKCTIDENNKLIDKIINEYGYKWHTLKIVLYTILLLLLCSYFIYNQNNFYWIVKLNLKVSSNFLIFLFTLSFCMKCIGAIFSGFMTNNDKIKRKNLIIICLFVMFSLNIMMGVHFSFPTYLIFLIFGCFCAGNIEILAYNILCEGLPINLRGSFLCICSIGYVLSDTIINYIIKYVYENNIVNIRLIFLISIGVMIFIFFLFIILPLNDSARNLLYKGEYEKAFEILNKLRTNELHEEEKLILINQSKLSEKVKIPLKENEINNTVNEKIEKDNSQNSIKDIFKEPYLKSTIIFIFIRFIQSFILRGNISIIVIYIKKILDNNSINEINSSLLFINNIALFSFPLSAILIDLKFIGRKLSLAIVEIIAIIILFIFFFKYQLYYLIGLYKIFLLAKTFILSALYTESYPTRMRDLTMGFLNIVDIIAGLIGMLSYMLLIKYNFLIPFYISFTLQLISLILFYLIPVETKNRPLDME